MASNYHPNAPGNNPSPRPAPTTAPRPATVIAPKPSKLGGLTASAVPSARRFFIYGPRKIGKTTVGADAPVPIFIDTTNSTEHVHVTRYPCEGPWTWQALMDALDDLLRNPHPYQTLVIEDVGDLEHNVVWKHVLATHKTDGKDAHYPTTIEGYGYGKGYNIAAQYWRELSARLDELRLKKGMHVIILGHSKIKNFKNPKGEDFETWQPAVHELAAGILGADFDVICFMSYLDSTKEKGAGFTKKTRGLTGDRVFYLAYDAAWPLVGCRLPMDSVVDVDLEHPFAPFAKAMAQANMSPALLKQKVDAELDRLGETFIDHKGEEVQTAKVRASAAAAAEAKDHDKLTRFLTVLRQAQPKTNETQEQTP